MKLFEQPVFEVIQFECEDIITTSAIKDDNDLDNDGFNNEIVKP